MPKTKIDVDIDSVSAAELDRRAELRGTSREALGEEILEAELLRMLDEITVVSPVRH